MTYENHFLLSLAFTTIVEAFVLIGVARYWHKELISSLSYGKLFFVGIFASFATLPYLWFILPSLDISPTFGIAIGEIVVTLIEAIFYAIVLDIGFQKTLTISCICNAVSYFGWVLVFQHLFNIT